MPQVTANLDTLVGLALESVYDKERRYGLRFWERTAETGGATRTMMREAFQWLADNPEAWRHLYA